MGVGKGREGKYQLAHHQPTSTPVATGHHGENDAGSPLGHGEAEWGTKKYWQGKVNYDYKVTFSDGTSITVQASSAKAARAMYTNEDKKILKIKKVKEKK